MAEEGTPPDAALPDASGADGASGEPSMTQMFALMQQQMAQQAQQQLLFQQTVEHKLQQIVEQPSGVAGGAQQLLAPPAAVHRTAPAVSAAELAAVLKAGGEASVATITRILDITLDNLDGSIARATDRKARRPARRVTMLLSAFLEESLDAEWCDGVAHGAPADLDTLATLLSAVRVMPADAELLGLMDAVERVLAALARCGNVILQTVAIVQASHFQDGHKLSVIRDLPEELLQTPNPDEVAAFHAIFQVVEGSMEAPSLNLQISLMSLYTLIVRNGFELGNSDGIIGLIGRVCCHNVDIVSVPPAVMSTISSAMITEAAQIADYACYGLGGLCFLEAPCKSPPDVRGPLEKVAMKTVMTIFKAIGKKFTPARVRAVIDEVMKTKVFATADVSLACGAAMYCYCE
jgi:hypothetical protein